MIEDDMRDYYEELEKDKLVNLLLEQDHNQHQRDEMIAALGDQIGGLLEDEQEAREKLREGRVRVATWMIKNGATLEGYTREDWAKWARELLDARE